MTTELTAKQREILSHTLGLDRKDAPYRNHYCAFPGNDSWEDLLELVALGMMTRNNDPLTNLQAFYATDRAIELMGA